MFGEIATLPRPILMLAASVGLFSTVQEMAHWSEWSGLFIADYILLTAAIPMWLGVTYVSSMMLVSARINWSGFLKFSGIMLLMFLPIMVGLVSALLLGQENSRLATVISLLVLGWLILTFLPAWPIAQAISHQFVSPIRILRATSGYRWSLVGVALVTGGFDKIVPATSAANSVGEAILLAIGNGLVSAMTMMIAASLGATAWRYASQNDRALRGHEAGG